MWKGNGLLWNKIQEGGRMRKLRRYDDRYGDTIFVDDSGYCLVRLANRKETTK